MTHASLRAANLRLCRHCLRSRSSVLRSSASSLFSCSASSASDIAPSNFRSNAPGPSPVPCEPGERSPNATRSARCCLAAEFSSYHACNSLTYSSSGTNSRGANDSRVLFASAVFTVTAISSDTFARDATCALSISSASVARSSSSSTSSAASSAFALAAVDAATASFSVFDSSLRGCGRSIIATNRSLNRSVAAALARLAGPNISALPHELSELASLT